VGDPGIETFSRLYYKLPSGLMENDFASNVHLLKNNFPKPKLKNNTSSVSVPVIYIYIYICSLYSSTGILKSVHVVAKRDV